MKKTKRLKLFALIGYPVGHTLSPCMHNAAFFRLGIKGLYIPLEVEPCRLKQTIHFLRTRGVCGFNVTIPHKGTCMRYLDKIDNLASVIGAVNTVVIKNKKLVGYNTDATGFIKSLKKDLRVALRDKKCLVIGAGGAGMAVAFALAKEGAKEIYIKDAVNARSNSLVKRIKKFFPKCYAKSITQYAIRDTRYDIDLLVNATPLGMRKGDKMPIAIETLDRCGAVYDIVYNRRTELVKQARKRNINSSNGLGMLLYQGAGAFELWTGKKAPVGAMKTALEKNIQN